MIYTKSAFEIFLFSSIFLFYGCNDSNTKKAKVVSKETSEYKLLVEKPAELENPEGMVWVKGKTFMQGAKKNDQFAMPREKPGHLVSVDGFFIDITEVTNSKFQEFVESTGYITVAERPIDWEVMKKQLPVGTQKPEDSLLQPGSLVFNRNVEAVGNMENYGQWWTWKIGANWKHPYGPNSNLEGLEDYPVVHIAYEDAIAFCDWAGRKLPTEAEWEAAAQGNWSDQIFTWGNEKSSLNQNANTWQGTFPISNESVDGFEYLSPVKSYPPNSIGIYDMLGNVWEWTSDYYHENYYKRLEGQNSLNPVGAEEHFNPENPYEVDRIIKGGSYLCHESYCASYRISAKMAMSLDSGSDHLGFRTVATAGMLTED